MNILAYDNNIYLVNLYKSSEDVYIVNIRYKIVQGYDNVHKIMRFGNYIAFDMNKLTKKVEDLIKNVFEKYDIELLIKTQ